MTVRLSGSLAAVFAALLMAGAGADALAQQAPAAPAAGAQKGAPTPPPGWVQGRPKELENSPLAPHPPALQPMAAKDIPVDKLKVPPGFKIELWAHGIPNARSMARGDKGTIFVGNRFIGKVFAVVDKGSTREVKTIAEGLHRPNGIAFRNGALYVAELSKVNRYDDIENKLDAPPKPVVIYDDLPKDEPHGWKYIAFGPDGRLYVPVGAPCNICSPPETHAQIRSITADGKDAKIVARGVRNTVGFDWHPTTRELWFTDHGRDWMGDNSPDDELNRVGGPQQHFGYPYCHAGSTLDPEFGKGKKCADYAAPELKLGPHIAALGMRFYTGNMFPAEYKNRIFIAMHGSWNRTQKIGFNVMQVTVQPDGKHKYEVFAEGWRDGEKFWGRPADVLVMPDGALLISDSVAGAIYRVSYRK
jgi:glucose/arabinose dehydrogenase